MEMILFCGLQGSGKTTFYHSHFARTHLRINLDMLRTRRRETAILQACLDVGQRLVVDNTNPTPAERARYLNLAREHKFRALAYHFDVPVETCCARNAGRSGKEVVRERGIRATAAKLVPPTAEEGFAEIYRVDAAGVPRRVSEVRDAVR